MHRHVDPAAAAAVEHLEPAGAVLVEDRQRAPVAVRALAELVGQRRGVDGGVVVGGEVRDVLVDVRRRSGPRRGRARWRTGASARWPAPPSPRSTRATSRRRSAGRSGQMFGAYQPSGAPSRPGAGGDAGFAEAAHREHLAQVGRRGDVLGRRHAARHEVHARAAPATSAGGRHCCFQSSGWRNSSSVTSCMRAIERRRRCRGPSRRGTRTRVRRRRWQRRRRGARPARSMTGM